MISHKGWHRTGKNSCESRDGRAEIGQRRTPYNDWYWIVIIDGRPRASVPTEIAAIHLATRLLEEDEK